MGRGSGKQPAGAKESKPAAVRKPRATRQQQAMQKATAPRAGNSQEEALEEDETLFEDTTAPEPQQASVVSEQHKRKPEGLLKWALRTSKAARLAEAKAASTSANLSGSSQL